MNNQDEILPVNDTLEYLELWRSFFDSATLEDFAKKRTVINAHRKIKTSEFSSWFNDFDFSSNPTDSRTIIWKKICAQLNKINNTSPLVEVSYTPLHPARSKGDPQKHLNQKAQKLQPYQLFKAVVKGTVDAKLINTELFANMRTLIELQKKAISSSRPSPVSEPAVRPASEPEVRQSDTSVPVNSASDVEVYLATTPKPTFSRRYHLSPILMSLGTFAILFSGYPPFALALGLSLSPACLVGIASVGTLMLIIGLALLRTERALQPKPASEQVNGLLSRLSTFAQSGAAQESNNSLSEPTTALIA